MVEFNRREISKLANSNKNGFVNEGIGSISERIQNPDLIIKNINESRQQVRLLIFESDELDDSHRVFHSVYGLAESDHPLNQLNEETLPLEGGKEYTFLVRLNTGTAMKKSFTIPVGGISDSRVITVSVDEQKEATVTYESL